MNTENTYREVVIDIKVEKLSDADLESDIELYADHEIKDEMVIGPVVLQRVVNDVPIPKKSRLDTQDNKFDQSYSPKEIRKEADSKETTTNEHSEDVDTQPKEQIKNRKRNKNQKTLNKPTKRRIETDKTNDQTTNNIFKCNDCNKQYDRKSDLVEHIQSHDKIKRDIYFKCRQCYVVLQRVVNTTNCYEDAPIPKKPRLDTEDKKTEQYDTPKERRKVPDPKEITKNEYKENTTGSDTGSQPKVQASTRSNKKFKIFNKPSTKRIETDKNCNKISNNVFKCNDCNKQYDRKSDIVEHIQSHEKIKRDIFFKCKQYSYADITQDTLQRHIKNVHSRKDKKHECGVCDYRSNNISNVKRHLLIHTGEKPYSCSMCEYKCSRKGSLKNHFRIHIGEKLYSCSMCEYKCNRKCDLKDHSRIHTGEKLFSCSMCEYKCSRKSYLKKHLRIHTGEKPYSCSMCEYKSSAKGHLKHHLRIHTGEKPYSCSMCEYKSVRSGMKNHLKIHTGEKPYSCSMCEYKCNRKGNLKDHSKIHTGEKLFSCSMCEYKCSRKSYLKKHLRIHTGEKPYSCSMCEYKSSAKGNLKHHLRIHTGEKPYSCSMCEYKCSRKSYLKKHLRIHTGEKPYSCSMCEYRCSRKDALKDHLRIHTGEKPFSCSMCEYRCSERGNLKKHLKIHCK